MNKTDLVDVIASEAGLKKKDAEAAYNALFGAVEKELVSGGKVMLAGFGTFKVKERAERPGRNPKTLEEITIPASKAAVFTPSKNLKDALK
ncbi:MAG: DNA-binding protein [Clostridiales bacterium GWF2_38_85]|nr:MAG: DNA-binding protein [Clostridiales bacterium GWF2_38_85]HBL83899.1 integration host factor subunit alpha [Clostridiales bacterium]